MILYFPVSALVTLFGNILQNPLDPRAKSDTKLMNLVVTFLSMLGQEAEQGGVHRMLGVCAEFERIGKVVIEKAEKGTELPTQAKEHGRSRETGTPSQERRHEDDDQRQQPDDDPEADGCRHTGDQPT